MIMYENENIQISLQFGSSLEQVEELNRAVVEVTCKIWTGYISVAVLGLGLQYVFFFFFFFYYKKLF